MSFQLNRREWLLGSTALAGATALTRLPGGQAWADISDPTARLDATAQANLVRSKEISPLELVDAAINRIERLEPTLNAIISDDIERARSKAKLEIATTGVFAGVPFLIKDLIDYPGLPHLSGSRMMAGNISTFLSPYVEEIDRAGLIVLGKTTTPEFGFIPTTEPVFDEPTRNPWNKNHSSGGSSGGAASAVASGMVPFAHASDGGGSIRIPASCCGLFGLKPSRGRQVKSRPYIRTPDLSVEHCLSRSVRDSAILLSVTEHQGPAAPLRPIGHISAPSSLRRTIAWSPKKLDAPHIHPDVKSAIENTALLCRDIGHTLVEVDLPFSRSTFNQHFKTVWSAGAASLAKRYKDIHGAWPDETALEPFTLTFARKFQTLPTNALPDALAYLASIETHVANLFSQIDLYLSPVLSTPAPLIGHLAPTVPFDTLWERMEAYADHTPWQNVAGVPAMSVPLSQSQQGLPIGSQFTAAVGKEATLLEIAYELERAAPWADNWPSLSANST